MNNAGIYSLITTDIYGCVSEDSVSVSLLFPDTTQINASICADTVYVFNGQNLNISGIYSWNGQNQSGCDSLVILDLQVNPLPVISAIDTLICANDCISLYAIGAQNYVWTNALDFGPQNSVCPSNSTTYAVYGIDAFGCASNYVLANVQVDPLFMPNFSISPMQVELSDPNITITNVVYPNHTYSWNILGELMANNSPSFTYQLPYQEGTYPITVNVSNELGCTDSATIFIEITNTLSVYVPNAFTPDGEEQNSMFNPVFSPGFSPSSYQFTIYNRWGEIVFQSQDLNQGWNGYLPDGIKCQDNVYNYHLSFRVEDGNEWTEIYGFVNLIK